MFFTVFRCIFWGVVQHLSHSIIHSVQEWSGLQRKIWFCDGAGIHIIVINNLSVRALCEQTGWLFIYDSPSSYCQHFIRFPLWRRPCFVSIPFWEAWWGNVLYKSPRSWLLLSPRTLKYSTFISGFPRSFWCDKSKHNKIPFAASRDQIHLRLRFCCDSFFTWIFLRSFRHRFGAACRAKDADIWKEWEDDSIHHVWNFPWSICLRVGFLVSMYFVWVLGSKLFLSNNQSRATLWVLETCLIVGLLPFMIILITASLSSSTYNKASWRTELTFEEIKLSLFKSSIIPWDFLFVFEVCEVLNENLTLVRTQTSPCLTTLMRVSVKNCDDQIP